LLQGRQTPIVVRTGNHRADMNTTASTMIQPTMTSELTAPAVILAISLRVYGLYMMVRYNSGCESIT